MDKNKAEYKDLYGIKGFGLYLMIACSFIPGFILHQDKYKFLNIKSNTELVSKLVNMFLESTSIYLVVILIDMITIFIYMYIFHREIFFKKNSSDLKKFIRVGITLINVLYLLSFIICHYFINSINLIEIIFLIIVITSFVVCYILNNLLYKVDGQKNIDEDLYEILNETESNFNKNHNEFKKTYIKIKEKYNKKLSQLENTKEELEFIKVEIYRLENNKTEINAGPNGMSISLLSILVTICIAIVSLKFKETNKNELVIYYLINIGFLTWLNHRIFQYARELYIYDLAINVLKNIKYEIKKQKVED